VKKINLEYTNIPVLFPLIDFFIENIRENKPFHFLRINHGVIDLIHLGYKDELSKFEESFINDEFGIIADRMIKASAIDVNTPLEIYHKQSKELKEKIKVFLETLKYYKSLSNKLQISVSLGIGLHQYHGIYEKNHPYQLARTEVWKIIEKYRVDEFYYSGVLKHYTIKKEIYRLFEELNNNDFLVVWVGREYMKLFQNENIFNIKKFHHINIPNKGAIDFVDEYIDEIKKLRETNEKIIVIHSIGHILSAYIANKLKDTDIFGLDIGRSFDLLVKNSNEPSLPRGWIDKMAWPYMIEWVDNLRKKSYG